MRVYYVYKSRAIKEKTPFPTRKRRCGQKSGLKVLYKNFFAFRVYIIQNTKEAAYERTMERI